jgi:hypothetical protein
MSFYANPNLKMARTVWGLVESRIGNFLYKSYFPKIRYNQLIYIPRVKQ